MWLRDAHQTLDAQQISGVADWPSFTSWAHHKTKKKTSAPHWTADSRPPRWGFNSTDTDCRNITFRLNCLWVESTHCPHPQTSSPLLPRLHQLLKTAHRPRLSAGKSKSLWCMNCLWMDFLIRLQWLAPYVNNWTSDLPNSCFLWAPTRPHYCDRVWEGTANTQFRKSDVNLIIQWGGWLCVLIRTRLSFFFFSHRSGAEFVLNKSQNWNLY